MNTIITRKSDGLVVDVLEGNGTIKNLNADLEYYHTKTKIVKGENLTKAVDAVRRKQKQLLDGEWKQVE